MRKGGKMDLTEARRSPRNRHGMEKELTKSSRSRAETWNYAERAGLLEKAGRWRGWVLAFGRGGSE